MRELRLLKEDKLIEKRKAYYNTCFLRTLTEIVGVFIISIIEGSIVGGYKKFKDGFVKKELTKLKHSLNISKISNW